MFFLLLSHQLFSQNKIGFIAYEPDSIFSKAKLTQKPVFLFVTGKGCLGCRILERNTFMDSTLIEFLNKNAITTKLDLSETAIDAYTLKAIKKELRLYAIPWLIFFDKKGKEIQRIGGGYIEPDEIIKAVNASILASAH